MNVKTIDEFINESKTDWSKCKTSVIALFYDKKVLILQRGSTAQWMPNKWSLVGGIVDDGEDIKKAVFRETHEEIGSEPFNVKYINKIKTDDSGTIFYYIGDLKTNKINLDYENSDHRFISINELDEFEFVPHVKDFIKSSFKLKNK